MVERGLDLGILSLVSSLSSATSKIPQLSLKQNPAFCLPHPSSERRKVVSEVISYMEIILIVFELLFWKLNFIFLYLISLF